MAWFGAILVIVLPMLLILKSLFLDRQRGQYAEWFQIVLLVHTLVLPIASGFVITSMVQKEYQDKTIRNILTAPTSRNHFVTAKLLVWLLWYLVTDFLAETIVFFGFSILFPMEFTSENIQMTFTLFTQASLFSFAAMTPVLWITFKQKALFYPSILTAMGFTVLELAGRQISEELLLPASICPWTAVSLAGMVSTNSVYFAICIASVFICCVLGILAALREFQGQDQ